MGKQFTSKAHVEKPTGSDEPTAPICKKCGAVMVLREAKKGKNAGNQFWGCTGFPKCRSVRKIES